MAEQGGTTVEKIRNYLSSVILHFDQNIVWPAAIFHLLTYYFKNMYYLGDWDIKFQFSGPQTCNDEDEEVAEEDDGVGGLAEVPLVRPELLDGLVEVGELDDLPDLRLPVVVGEAEVEAEAEVGEVEVGGEVDGDGHHLRAHHWSGGWRLVVGGLRSGGDYCQRRTAARLYTETEGRGRAPPHKPASTSWTGTRSLTVALEQLPLCIKLSISSARTNVAEGARGRVGPPIYRSWLGVADACRLCQHVPTSILVSFLFSSLLGLYYFHLPFCLVLFSLACHSATPGTV